MEIILLENIINLGNIGDKVIVKSGYGRNYLLKKNKALRFSEKNLDYVSKIKDELNKKNVEAKKNTKILLNQLIINLLFLIKKVKITVNCMER